MRLSKKPKPSSPWALAGRRPGPFTTCVEWTHAVGTFRVWLDVHGHAFPAHAEKVALAELAGAGGALRCATRDALGARI